MRLHVLSGDSLLVPFKGSGIEGEIAVFRECLVDGPTGASGREEFFAQRDRYLSDSKDDGFYESSVRPEIEKILDSPEGTEINLWFEHELFCQVNLWFLLHNLGGRDSVWFVFPPPEPFERRFAGWAQLDADGLSERFEKRVSVSEEDRSLGSELWQAFSAGDSERLKKLGNREAEIFFYLDEVADAAAGIGSRPEELVREIVSEGGEDFPAVFRAFLERMPVYGFGDLQVKSIWDRVSGKVQEPRADYPR